MLSEHPSPQALHGAPPNTTTSAFIQAAATPVLAIVTLLFACFVFNEALSDAYLILVLLVFALTFPGRTPAYGGGRLSLALDILTHWLVIALFLLLLGWVTQTLDYFDRHVIAVWIVATPLALIAVQTLYPWLITKMTAADGAHRVAIIAGGGALAHRLTDGIERSPFLGIRVAGYFDDRARSRIKATDADRHLGGLNELAAYAKTHRVDVIYINLPMTSQPRIIKLLDELRDTTTSIYFVPDIFVADLIQARMDTVAGIPVLAVCETPFYGVNGPIKRLSDLVLASLILILIAPLMLTIAVAIKYSSPGPVLFKQRRYGLDGREIIVYKFRSMTVCEDGGEIRQATRNDSRVTPLGAFLRASSLDELPQFINVLQGRMSIVGPRPHAVAHNEMYRKLINGYMIRHKVRPGITGLAQVNGERGETATLDRMQARVDYDLSYLRDWSLQLDLQIILKTLFVVWQKKNAY